jgi:hypothetical protein
VESKLIVVDMYSTKFLPTELMGTYENPGHINTQHGVTSSNVTDSSSKKLILVPGSTKDQ